MADPNMNTVQQHLDEVGSGIGTTAVPVTEAAGGEEEENQEEGAEKEAEKEAEVKPAAEKVCVQLVNSLDDYTKIDVGTTIAIKQDGAYTVFKKGEGDDDKFIENNTFQHLSNSVMGGKRRKSAKRGRKSSKGGRKSAKRGRKSVKRGRKGKGSRRSKK